MQIPSEIVRACNIVLDDKYFNLSGLSEYSSMSKSALRYHIRENGLPHFAIRNDAGQVTQYLIRRSEFDFWMKKRWRDDLDELVNGVMADLRGGK